MRERRPPYFIAGLLAIVVLGGALGWNSRYVRVDDALITHRYAKNLAEGHGWVYNVGERHNGSTSPLFTIACAVLGRAIGDYPLAAGLISILSLIAAALMSAELLRRAGYGLAGIIVGLALASNPLMVFTFGLETQLFLAFATASALSLQSGGSPVRTAVFASLATLTRGDGFVLLVLGYLYHAWRERRLLWKPIVASVLVALPWVVYSLAAIGSPVPDTLGAKGAQSAIFGASRFTILLRGPMILRQFGFQRAYNLAPFLLAPLGLWLGPPGVLLLFASSAIQLLVYSLIPVDAFHWYFAPALHAALLLAGVGLARVARGQPRAGQWLPYAIAAALLVPQVRDVSTVRMAEDLNYVELGHWLRANAPASASVALFEVGTVGWYSGLRVVDPLGLVTPASDHVRLGDLSWWIDERKPTFIVLHRPLWGGTESQVAEHPSFARDYLELRVVGPPGSRQCVVYQRTGGLP